MGKLFNLFSGDANKKSGPTKQQVERDKNMGLVFFFKLLKNRIGNITVTSIVFSLTNFPIFLFLLGISGNLDTTVPAPSSPLYAQVYGLQMAGAKGPLLASFQALFGSSSPLQVYSTASNILRYCGLLLLLTLGISMIGMAFNQREVVRCQPLSPFVEFFSAIKKNLKQGLIIAILDGLFIVFLYYDIIIYYANMKTGSFFMQMAFYLIIIVCLLYYLFRFYLFTILVTFDMKFRTMLKNALYLLFLGWKRNLVCLIASGATIFLFVYLYLLLPSVGILLPVIFGFGFLGYIGIYCTYPIIQRYIIDPYYKDHPEEDPNADVDQIESIFTDRG